MKKRIGMLLPIVMLIIANGCSSAGSIANMVPKIMDVYPQSTKSLKLGMISGGAEPSAVIWDGPGIYPNNFEVALLMALNKAKLFRQVNSVGSSDYTLNVLIWKQAQGLVDLSANSILAVIYTLIDSRTGDEIWKKEIFSDFTASTSFCIGGFGIGGFGQMEANDGAVRENIRQLLDELSKLGL